MLKFGFSSKKMWSGQLLRTLITMMFCNFPCSVKTIGCVGIFSIFQLSSSKNGFLCVKSGLSNWILSWQLQLNSNLGCGSWDTADMGAEGRNACGELRRTVRFPLVMCRNNQGCCLQFIHRKIRCACKTLFLFRHDFFLLLPTPRESGCLLKLSKRNPEWRVHLLRKQRGHGKTAELGEITFSPPHHNNVSMLYWEEIPFYYWTIAMNRLQIMWRQFQEPRKTVNFKSMMKCVRVFSSKTNCEYFKHAISLMKNDETKL